MNGLERGPRTRTRRPRRVEWTPENEEQLQQALEDGDVRSMRRWQGRNYGVVW